MITTTTYTNPQSAVEDMAKRLAKGSNDRDSLLEARQRYVSEAFKVEQMAFGVYRMPKEIRELVEGATPALAIDVPELTKWLCKGCGQATRLHEFTDYCMRCVEDSGPGLEPEPPTHYEIPTINKEIIAVLELYSNTIITRVESDIRQRGLRVIDFCYTGKGKTSRLGAAWELASRGGWKLPKDAGQPFLIDSGRAGAGNLAYQVYVEGIPGHGGSQCGCEDHAYSRTNTSGLCKHVLAGLILYYASMAFKSEYSEIGRMVAA
jgi:hypothetical protein